MFESLKTNLDRRSAIALAVVASSFFLMVCIARYGGGDFQTLHSGATPGLAARLSGSLVQTVGVGVWALVLLPLAWGVVFYFQQRTPDLVLRLAGTVLLAVSLSTIVGLAQGGLWAGHVGNAAARALGGLSLRMDGVGTALAWLLALTLFSVSLIFATDWMFHSLRRAGRAAAVAREIAVEPPCAELKDAEEPVVSREFVNETPRAAVAAAEIAKTATTTRDFAETPTGWSEEEWGGRTVIAAPPGYRGVEFLPPSDELAIPDAPPPRDEIRSPVTAESAEPQSSWQRGSTWQPEPAAPLLVDEDFVATSDVAYFVPAATETSESEEEEIAPVLTEAFQEEPSEELSEEPVVEAVMTLFEAVTSETPAAPRQSGIGLPDDSPFLDEFFPVAEETVQREDSQARPSGPSDGASTASEFAAAFPSPAAPVSSPAEPREAASRPAPVEEPEASKPEEFDTPWIEEILLTRISPEVFDDAIATYEERGLSASVEPDSVEDRNAERFEAPAAVETEEVVPPARLEPEEVVATLEEIEIPQEVFAETAVETEISVARELAEPAPQLPLFADTEVSLESAHAESAVATLPALDLARLHTMELDPLFQDAVAAVLGRGRASAVVLQRQLGIGYARGIRILDQMTAAGLAGPDTPTGAREIRISSAEWDAFRT